MENGSPWAKWTYPFLCSLFCCWKSWRHEYIWWDKEAKTCWIRCTDMIICHLNYQLNTIVWMIPQVKQDFIATMIILWTAVINHCPSSCPCPSHHPSNWFRIHPGPSSSKKIGDESKIHKRHSVYLVNISRKIDESKVQQQKEIRQNHQCQIALGKGFKVWYTDGTSLHVYTSWMSCCHCFQSFDAYTPFWNQANHIFYYDDNANMDRTRLTLSTPKDLILILSTGIFHKLR